MHLILLQMLTVKYLQTLNFGEVYKLCTKLYF